MARLPIPGQDENQWGDVLNDYLTQAHNADGSLKAAAVSSVLSDASATTKGVVQLGGDLAGTAAAPTVPGLADKADATDLTNHVNDTAGVHAASAISFTAGGTIAATDAQAAVAEVASDAASALSAHAADATIHSSGRELGFVSTSSGILGFTNATYTDWSAMSLSVTIGIRPVTVVVELPALFISAGAPGGVMNVAIYDVTGGVRLREGVYQNQSDNIIATMHLETRHAPAAGSRTYRLQYKVQAGQTGVLAAYDGGFWGWGPTNVPFMYVVER